MLKNYFKIAWRNLLRQKTFSLINIGGLAVAMTAAVLIMMWVQNETSFDRYHPDADRIYLVKNQLQTGMEKTGGKQIFVSENSPAPLPGALKNQVAGVELVAYAKPTRENEFTLRIGDQALPLETSLYVDSNWFSMFRYKFVAGSPESFFSHPHSIALTVSKARQLFGTKDVTGQPLLIDTTAFIVRAVIADNPINSSMQFNLLLPIDADHSINRNYWHDLNYKTFVRLGEGVDPGQLPGQINRIYKASREEDNLSAALLPLSDLRFDRESLHSAFKHVSGKTVQIFRVLAMLLLVVASVNYVNLAVARAGVRSKELGIRKISGADRRTLFLQLLTESLLTSLLSMAVTLLLVWALMPWFNAYTGMPFTFKLLLTRQTLIVPGTLLCVILLTGIYPAFLLSAFNPVKLLTGNNLFAFRGADRRKVLVVGQFALTVIMILAAITVLRQLAFIQQQDPGYDRSQVFTVQIPDKDQWKVKYSDFESWEAFVAEEERVQEGRWQYLQLIKQELQSRTSIAHVAGMFQKTVQDNSHTSSGGLDWEGRPEDFNPEKVNFYVDADMNDIMGWEVVRGRWFHKNSIADRNNFILNETAVREFGLPEPVIGMPMGFGRSEGRVVGIVRDFHHKSMHEKIDPVVIVLRPVSSKSLVIESTEGQAAAALQAARAIMNEHFPAQPFIYQFLDEEFEELYRRDRRALTFIMIFSGLCVLLSCLGLLGMAIFSARRRTREIGIRKTLGASVAGMVALLTKEFIRLVLIAILIATPLAWYAMNRWLQDFAYRIELQWWMFVVAGLLALIVALLTVSLQSVKAALANPVKSLRAE